MMLRQWKAAIVALLALCAVTGRASAQDRPLVPPAFELNEAAAKAVDAEWLTPQERAALRVFHGVWDDRDLTTSTQRALIALNAWRFDDPALADETVAIELRAEALLKIGEFERAITLLEGARSNHAARIRAEALEGLGRTQEALASISAVIDRMLEQKINDPAELTEGVRAMMIRARLQGQPARDYETMMRLLGRAHQELDRLYWPAKLAEAELLLEKDNDQEAIAALHETLALNPRAAEGWYMLGHVALERFDFDSAGRAADALRRINRQHPFADLLTVEVRLTQDDPEGAREILTPLLERYSKLRPALAFDAAAQALYYNDAALKAALDRYEALSPGSALAYYTVGRQLSFNRQYEAAADALEEAILRKPAWPAPQIELGLMELQSGRDDRALQVLQTVVKLDPFNKRAANSLFLLEEIATYAQIETEHFIIRYKPGIDRVTAELMPGQLEQLHAIVAGRFDWTPDRKTVIEVMPDHQRFAVRITGMPFVHTIAACTGPVIAMEVPREGPANKHHGPFDWRRVLQHEYTHTITLGQTRNRIPHWLTEAAAVSMELAPRDYETCMMLAQSYEAGTLFDLDEIKWAFVRPKRPNDRGKAYAQGHWMVQFMNERFGESALVRLLARYFEGEREQQAIPNALGVSREQFYRDFLEWAGAQVNAWGMAAEPSITEMMDELRWADPDMALTMAASQQARLDVIVRHLTEQIGRPNETGRRSEGTGGGGLTADRWPPLVRPPIEVDDETLARWIDAHPDHPDLAELALRRRFDRLGEDANVENEGLMSLLQRYTALRPVDPFPHRKLAQMWLTTATPEQAITHLEELDVREEKTPVYAIELAKLYRSAGQIEKSVSKAARAVQINPYNAPNRELAAAIAIEAQQFDQARRHIEALTLIEPDRPQHAKRLEAIDKLIAERK